MTDPAPSIIVIAGPNGAGKSTAAPALLRDTLLVSEYVNADVIAQGLSAFAPERAALRAGRIMLGQLHELAEARRTFAFKTTLASRSFAPWLAWQKRSGYLVNLVFCISRRRIWHVNGWRPACSPEDTTSRKRLSNAVTPRFAQLFCTLRAARRQLVLLR